MSSHSFNDLQRLLNMSDAMDSYWRMAFCSECTTSASHFTIWPSWAFVLSRLTKGFGQTNFRTKNHFFYVQAAVTLGTKLHHVCMPARWWVQALDGRVSPSHFYGSKTRDLGSHWATKSRQGLTTSALSRQMRLLVGVEFLCLSARTAMSQWKVRWLTRRLCCVFTIANNDSSSMQLASPSQTNSVTRSSSIQFGLHPPSQHASK